MRVIQIPKTSDYPNLPNFSSSGIELYKERIDKYIQKLQEKIKSEFKEPYSGEIVKFPVADGYALYIVISLENNLLGYIDVYDRYEYKYIRRLTKGDVIKRIEGERKMKEFFSKVKK